MLLVIFPRQTSSPLGYHHYNNEGTNPRPRHRVWNTTRNSKYIPLHPDTKASLLQFCKGKDPDFVDAIEEHPIIVKEIARLINRGPVFTPWMVRKIVHDVVKKNRSAGFPEAAYAAVDVLAHYIIHEDTKKLNGKWKTQYVKSSRYEIDLLKSDPFDHEIYVTLERIAFQPFARDREETLDSSALVYAIVYAAAIRVAKQRDIDNSEYVGRITAGLGIVFAAMNIAAGASPFALLGSVAENISSSLGSALVNHVKGKYPPGDFEGAITDVMQRTIKTPTQEGTRILGLLTNNSTHRATTERKKCGQVFLDNLNKYFQYLNFKEPGSMTRARS